MQINVWECIQAAVCAATHFCMLPLLLLPPPLVRQEDVTAKKAAYS